MYTTVLDETLANGHSGLLYLGLLFFPFLFFVLFFHGISSVALKHFDFGVMCYLLFFLTSNAPLAHAE